MGRLVASNLKYSIKLDDEEKRNTWYMQEALEMSMKREFGTNLGCVQYVVTYRDNLTLINIPLQDHIVLISTERNADSKQIAEYSRSLFVNNTQDLPEKEIITIK